MQGAVRSSTFSRSGSEAHNTTSRRGRRHWCVSAEIGLILRVCLEDEVIQAVGHPGFVPSSMGPEAIRMKMMFDKHFVQKRVEDFQRRLAQRESAGKISSATANADSVLEAALVANVSRRESVQPSFVPLFSDRFLC